MIKVSQYDGTFELAFLTNYERVRSAGNGTGAVQVESVNSDRVTRVELNDYLLREPDGSITILKPDEVSLPRHEVV